MAKAPKADSPENEVANVAATEDERRFWVRMVKDGEELFVHETTVKAHKAIGWVVSVA